MDPDWHIGGCLDPNPGGKQVQKHAMQKIDVLVN